MISGHVFFTFLLTLSEHSKRFTQLAVFTQGLFLCSFYVIASYLALTHIHAPMDTSENNFSLVSIPRIFLACRLEGSNLEPGDISRKIVDFKLRKYLGAFLNN